MNLKVGRNIFQTMEYFKAELPSLFLPDKLYTWDNHGLAVFPSNKNKGGNKITLDNTLTTVIIFSDNGLTKETVTSTLRKYVTFLVFYGNDYYSARWLIHQFWGDIDKKIKKCKNLNRIISNNIEKKLKRPRFVYRNFESTHVAFRDGDLFNFKELADKYFSLDDDDKLKEQIDLMAFTWVRPGLISNLYDNVNLDISLTYTLMDSVIKDSKISESDVKRCSNCGHETRGKKSDRKRIRDFVGTLELTERNQNLYEQIILNIYQIRNAFFHEGRSITIQRNTKRAMTVNSLESKSITVELEAEHGQSRLLGVFNIRIFLTGILVSNLEQR